MSWSKVDKHGPQSRAERVEYISSTTCLECGHLITDHKRAGIKGVGRNEQVENGYGVRDGCIGDRGTCQCHKFTQPHQFSRHSVIVKGLKA